MKTPRFIATARSHFKHIWEGLRKHWISTAVWTVILGLCTNFLYDELKREPHSTKTGKQTGPASPDSRSKPSSSRQSCTEEWRSCAGIENLPGLWVGKIFRGPGIQVELETTKNVSAFLTIESLACKAQLKLVQVNGMFTTSEFFFKPVERIKGCPDIQTMKLTPLPSSATLLLTLSNGKQLSAVLDKQAK